MAQKPEKSGTGMRGVRGPSPVTECSSTQTEMSDAGIPMPMPSHDQRERGGGAIDLERAH